MQEIQSQTRSVQKALLISPELQEAIIEHVEFSVAANYIQEVNVLRDQANEKNQQFKHDLNEQIQKLNEEKANQLDNCKKTIKKANELHLTALACCPSQPQELI